MLQQSYWKNCLIISSQSNSKLNVIVNDVQPLNSIVQGNLFFCLSLSISTHPSSSLFFYYIFPSFMQNFEHNFFISFCLIFGSFFPIRGFFYRFSLYFVELWGSGEFLHFLINNLLFSPLLSFSFIEVQQNRDQFVFFKNELCFKQQK